MPALNLRLTDEQLKELRRWAQGNRRSLQNEVIWRLFGPHNNHKPSVRRAHDPSEAETEMLGWPVPSSLRPPFKR